MMYGCDCCVVFVMCCCLVLCSARGCCMFGVVVIFVCSGVGYYVMFCYVVVCYVMCCCVVSVRLVGSFHVVLCVVLFDVACCGRLSFGAVCCCVWCCGCSSCLYMFGFVVFLWCWCGAVCYVGL